MVHLGKVVECQFGYTALLWGSIRWLIQNKLLVTCFVVDVDNWKEIMGLRCDKNLITNNSWYAGILQKAGDMYVKYFAQKLKSNY